MQDLPEECVREVILRINDHRDLESSARAWTLMASLVSEQRVWRELTQFHFNKNEIDHVICKQLEKNKVQRVNDSTTEYNNKFIFATDMENRNGIIANENLVENRKKPIDDSKDWQQIYHALRRYFR